VTGQPAAYLERRVVCLRDVALLQDESLVESFRFANNGHDMFLTVLAVSVS
jgi:hypothetical protein